MILDASSKIAVKCGECGKYNIVDINIFELKMPTSLRCGCGHKMFRARVAKGELILDIYCIACEREHSYRFKLRDLLERPLNIISCPLTGMEISFLGRDCHVDDVVKRYTYDMLELLKALGAVEERMTNIVK